MLVWLLVLLLLTVVIYAVFRISFNNKKEIDKGTQHYTFKI
jgi:hypothetical protein